MNLIMSLMISVIGRMLVKHPISKIDDILDQQIEDSYPIEIDELKEKSLWLDKRNYRSDMYSSPQPQPSMLS